MEENYLDSFLKPLPQIISGGSLSDSENSKSMEETGIDSLSSKSSVSKIENISRKLYLLFSFFFLHHSKPPSSFLKIQMIVKKKSSFG